MCTKSGFGWLKLKKKNLAWYGTALLGSVWFPFYYFFVITLSHRIFQVFTLNEREEHKMNFWLPRKPIILLKRMSSISV